MGGIPFGLHCISATMFYLADFSLGLWWKQELFETVLVKFIVGRLYKNVCAPLRTFFLVEG